MRSWISRIIDRIAPESVRFDPYALHQDCMQTLQLARESEWLALESFAGRLSVSERSLLIESVSEVIHNDGYFDDWISRRSSSATAFLFRGSLYQKRAWVYRGFGRGNEVSDEAAIAFNKALECSFDDFSRSTNLAPSDPEPIGRSIRTLMGLSADWGDIDIALEKLDKIAYPHFIGNLNYLVASCEKWLGSHEKMFAFARKRAAGDARLAGLIPAAHFEMHFYLERFEKDQQAVEAYFRDQKIIDEILAARAAFMNTKLDPDSATYVFGHNIFALVFSIAGRIADSKPHFEAVGRRIIRYAWEFYDDRYFQDMRRNALNAA